MTAIEAIGAVFFWVAIFAYMLGAINVGHFLMFLTVLVAIEDLKRSR